MNTPPPLTKGLLSKGPTTFLSRALLLLNPHAGARNVPRSIPLGGARCERNSMPRRQGFAKDGKYTNTKHHYTITIPYSRKQNTTTTPSTTLHTNQTLQIRFVNEDTRKRKAMRKPKRESNAKRGSAKPRCERMRQHGSAQTKSLIKQIGANQLANEGKGSIYWRRARSVKSLSNCASRCMKCQ